MKTPFRKRLFAAAGHNTVFYGSGRKEFNPKKMPPYETYLLEAGVGTTAQLQNPTLDEGYIANFMAQRFINQGNLPGFLPYLAPNLIHKPCTSVEGACGSGGRAIAAAARAILSDAADSTLVVGFEVQNTMKALYGADALAGAAHYSAERKKGHAFFFPGLFSDRTGAYANTYGTEITRKGMAHWYAHAITQARLHPKAQEYHNTTNDLIALGMTPPNPKGFVDHLNLYDCSKVSDGASSIVLFSEEGLSRAGIPTTSAIEIIAIGAAQGDITLPPSSLTTLSTTTTAISKALAQASITANDIGHLELHDCFSITALLTLEALGICSPGHAPHYIIDGHIAPTGTLPTNLTGGLCGFGHPTGATGVRMLVDLLHSTSTSPKPYGLMISMGGNDKTVTAIVTKRIE